MVEFKLVLSNPKTGKSYQKEVKEPAARSFVGMKIGDKVKGDMIELPGYEFEISGGSDYCGFPMRKDIDGTNRKKILAVSGVGMRKAAKGIRQKKTIAGNTIFSKTVQINLKVLKEGSMPLGIDKEPEKKSETAAPEAKIEPKAEKKAEEKPKVEKKEVA